MKLDEKEQLGKCLLLLLLQEDLSEVAGWAGWPGATIGGGAEES